MAEQQKIEKLRKLREQFRAQMPARLDALKAAVSSLPTVNDQTAALEEFHRLVHSLAGTAGTFGLPEIGVRAREIEQYIVRLVERKHRVGPAEAESITRRLAELELPAAEAEAIAEASVSPATEATKAMASPDDGQRVFVIEDDQPLAEEIAAQLRAYGWTVNCFGDVATASRALETVRPKAIVADAMLPEGDLAGIEFARQARQRSAARVVVISQRWDWESRLAAARAGADDYLPKPLNINTLVDRLDTLTRRQEEHPYRVLILDDEPLLAEHHAEVLNAAGMHATAITEPHRLPDSLNELQPELVLMDLYMHECTGIEAARVIRQDERYAGTPIVFLSTESGRQQQLSAMETGADDFLTKPIGDAELVAAVGLRVARFRTLTALIRQDSLTGLLNRIAFDLQTEAEIDRAHRGRTPLALAMLDIDHFKNINDTHGHPVGDRVIKSLAQLLRKRLRKYDVIGRHGGEEFCVLMPDTSPNDAVEVLNGLREQYARLHHSAGETVFSCTFSAGMAMLDEQVDRSALVAAADEALYEAKRAGRNRVRVARDQNLPGDLKQAIESQLPARRAPNAP